MTFLNYLFIDDLDAMFNTHGLWPLDGARTSAGHNTWVSPIVWSGSEPGSS